MNFVLQKMTDKIKPVEIVSHKVKIFRIILFWQDRFNEQWAGFGDIESEKKLNVF